MATGVSILTEVIKPQLGSFSIEHAQYVLSLDFSPAQHARYADLSERVQDGALSHEEDVELEEFVAASALLTILQSKARNSLRSHNPAA